MPREVWILSAANVMIALGYGVISPVMPAFARSFGVSITAVTFVITVFSVTRLCFAPMSGLLVQRLGERRIYLSGLLVVAFSTAACAFARTYPQLLVCRAVNGIGSTMFFVSAFGLMIHISPPDARGRIAGVFSTSFMLGAVGGPVIGSLMAGWGLKAPFLLYGVLLLVVAAGVFLGLRHSDLAAPPPPTRSAAGSRSASSMWMQSCAVPTESLQNSSDAWTNPAADIRRSIVAVRLAAAVVDPDQATQTPSKTAYEPACRKAPKIRPRHATSRTMPNASNRPVDGSGTAAKVRVVDAGRL
jgi:MFS family permease